MRRYFLLGVAVLVAAARVAAAEPMPIVDSLGTATPTTTFSIFGTWGSGISATSYAGPRFTLSEPTTITEIGAILNNCSAISLGIPYCPDARPFVVEIRPSTNGAPDPVAVLATFPLSHDDDPLLMSFEAVAPDLLLPAGTYFALFAPQGADAGYLLGGTSTGYAPGEVTMGWLYDAWGTGVPVSAGTAYPIAGPYPAAVRILGTPATPQGVLETLVVTVETLVASGVLTPEEGAELTEKLTAAVSSLADGRVDTACKRLGAFINAVDGFAGDGRLPADAAHDLVERAQLVRTMIGCGS